MPLFQEPRISVRKFRGTFCNYVTLVGFIKYRYFKKKYDDITVFLSAL